MIPFVKMHGCGNDFVLVREVDLLARGAAVPESGDPDWRFEPAELTRRICDRHFGIGADGLLVYGPRRARDGVPHLRMFYWNADGSRAEMCGNGARCVVRLAYDRGESPASLVLETDAGPRAARVVLENRAPRAVGEGAAVGVVGTGGLVGAGGVVGAGGAIGAGGVGEAGGTNRVVGLRGAGGVVCAVELDMGPAAWHPSDVPVTASDPMAGAPLRVLDRDLEVSAVSMGNPHAIVLVPDRAALERTPLETLGRALAEHAVFPAGANASFVAEAGGELHLRVWERGVGPTLACGTATCAAYAVARRLGRLGAGRARVHVPGGVVEVWEADDGHLWLAGPAAYIAEGMFSAELLA